MTDTPRPAAAVPAQIAKGALRRLAMSKLEPTPTNYARAYADEAGEPAPAEGALPARARAQVDRLVARATDDPALRGELSAALMDGRHDELQKALDRSATASAAAAQAWAQLVDRLARGLERGGKNWTGARKKDSLQRVLDSSRSDAVRLQQRLRQLISAWEKDQADVDVDTLASDSDNGPAATPAAAPAANASAATPEPAPSAAGPVGAIHDRLHDRIHDELASTVRAGLPADEPRARQLADELAGLGERIRHDGATPALADAVADVCLRARRLLGLRHELVAELLALCTSLTDGLTDLAEDGSWAQGQGQALRQRLDGVNSARAVRAARELLDDTRERQRALQAERSLARYALKQIVREVLSGLGDLAGETGRFSDKVQGYAEVIEAADSLDSLGAVVRELLGESRAVHQLMASARERLDDEHRRANTLAQQVDALEGELRRLSDEVSTDALTQVANRRGLAKAFEQESARAVRDSVASAPLAVGLIDIDNFKKLNDSLGHAAGDVALKSLAARVTEWLRPIDHVARFGGEEFVVLLPATPVAEGQQVLTRLQRRLSASLFMHQGREVFVTFSAGVSAWQPGETLEAALARADEGLYEAKRTGKNRTCIA